ncbi:yippee-like protein [Acaromyces ingoldii]|uniref:Protein yippee-like n=1 Tax=Acaromyces ingoldii TaxID=215250 RepID=A0A316YN08_9BASI|nr:yippee-like protein [Acaromyces ingoldii]PWN90930.1 yippee-like protein [Acaromyces ingoldii]
MGMVHREYLASSRIFGCKKCKTHLTTIERLVSRNFNGQTGRACLFDHVVNITLGDADDRQMTTGLHTVRDVRCANCSHILGWKYDKAHVDSERYKEKKFILERALIDDVE